MKIAEDTLKGILLISLIAVGVLFFYQKSLLKDAGVERVEVKEEEEKDWETYKSMDLGFEFKYPQDWEVREGEDRTIIYSPEELDILNNPSYTDAPLGISFKTFANDNELSLQEWLQERFGVETLDVNTFDPEANARVFSIKSIEPVIINNQEMFLVKEAGIGDSIVQIYYMNNGKAILEFAIIGQSDETFSAGQEILKTVFFEKKENEEMVEDEIVLNFEKETYYNPKLQFYFEYPAGQDWTFEEGSQEGEVRIYHIAGERDRYFTSNGIKISTYIRGNNQNLSVSDWLDTLPGASRFDELINSKEEITVDNRVGLRINMTDDFGKDIETVFLPLEYGKILEVNLLPPNPETLAIFNQIINSFEFVEAISISDWETYRNEEYGFEIQYPEDYFVFQEGENFVQVVDEGYKGIEGEIPSIRVAVKENEDSIELQDWFIENKELYIGSREIEEVENFDPSIIEISGKEAATLTLQGMGEVRITVLRHGSDIIEFTAHTLSSFERQPDFLNMYNSILASYKTL